MTLSPILRIDLDALARNYKTLARHAAPSMVAAVVKADAYGLGVGPVSARLFAEGCRHFFVATLSEGVELRAVLDAFGDVPIYVMNGPNSDEADVYVQARLTPVLNSPDQIQRWRSIGRPAVLHLDTGMNRLGLSDRDLTEFDQLQTRGPAIEIVYVMTHLACADSPPHHLNEQQIRLFTDRCQELPGVPTSIGNSAGALQQAERTSDMVRPGIALYGGNPFIDRKSPVEPVASLTAPIIQVRTIEQAGTIGYAASFAVPAGAVIATVALGYADGYLRALGNAGVASVAGVHVPVVGRISMDLLTLDVSAAPAGAVAEGTYVELFGRDVSIDDVAKAAGTISYELLTSIGRRVKREYFQA
jgi:alanine racemase